VLAVDDPTNEVGAAWGIKEQLRQVLAAPTVAEARQRRRLLEYYALVADMPETTKLVSTVAAWWPEIDTLVRTRVTNAKTEAANLTIKNTKRTGRGFRNPSTTDAASGSSAPPGRRREHPLNRGHHAQWRRAA
jgi:hypothetical protein